jgi:hypothetical protein
MAIAYTSSTSFTDGNGTSIAGVAKPASTAIGDLLVAQLYLEDGITGVSIASTGDTWTLVHQIINTTPVPDMQIDVWVTVVANASSTIGVTWGGGSFWRDFAVHRFTGVDTTTPQDVTATENTGTSATLTGLGLASGSANRWLVLCGVDFDGRTASSWTSPLTERNDSGNVKMAAGEDAAGTDTANKTATLSAGGSDWASVMLALRNAGGAAAEPAQMVSRLRRMGVG